MEHRTTSTLSWSALHQGYELSDPQREVGRRLTRDDPAWFAWLEAVSSFAFYGHNGSFTARKETKQRGARYWYAYRKREGTLAKTYLGKTTDLTFARLEGAASVLQAPRATTARSPVPRPPPAPRETGRRPTPMEAQVAEPHLVQAEPTAAHAHGESLAPLLATKLHQPRPRAQLVPRVHLVERLQQGLSGALTLASAPAGFGKTTLISQWLAGCARPAAWLSLDERDNDPARFLAYLVAALQTIGATIGAGILRVLQASQPPPFEALLTTLLNDLTTLPDPFVLVLDDYHLIEAQAVNQALTYLVEHLPPQMHLVLATREDPPLPLARLRARGQVTELRAADLRFTPVEAVAFLKEVMGLSLSAEDIAALERRTEGWIAGLQLAALSLQRHEDPARFIQAFTGSHQFVLDYLVEEVLQQQSQHVQTFLLRTSILERLCGPLCEAVALDPATPGQATLEALDRANLFLVPLDHERQWYRYHHLFAEVLRQRLRQRIPSAPEEEGRGVAELHQRASFWYEAQGLALEAFQHAAAAQDVDRAARLIEGQGMPRHFGGAMVPVLRWLASLPKAVLDERPSLWVKYAGLLLVNGQAAGVEEKLQAAEAALAGVEPDDDTRNLVGQIAAARATLALTRYQADIMLAQSRRALEYLHPTNLAFRATASWTLGYAYFFQGDRTASGQAFTEAIVLSQASEDPFATLLATLGLGNIQEVGNQLHQAAETYRQVLRLAGEQPLQVIYEAHLGLARIGYEWNDLEAAEQHGRQALHLARQFGSGVDGYVRCEVFLSRLLLAQSDVIGATARLAEASEETRQHHFVARLPEVATAQVLTLLHQGQLAAAAQLAETHGLPLSQARVHLAAGDPSAALAVLAPWREQVEARGWVDERLKAQVLEALALQSQGEQDQAVQVLGEALALAQPGGCIRTFVDEGAPMAHLLAQVAAQGLMPDYLGKVCAVFEAEEHQDEDQSSPPPAQPLIEPLSRREVEVLQLIAQGLSNQEISQRLVLAVSTVKGHNLKIFGKLQVQRRTEAVARARALGLV
jgi:LuxR family transcriptional regulator, maltose regulon positive regulatory protein